ncbi:sulfatase-like hydrolase/transferase [Nocardioides anomalus]|uniref:Sulfatase-like hydrolase/transferase n=1 Tax=Nocardioides anomalus TaxID=2712223 RepID=A0A6G6W943_9ACTN|nr:sulfatase-like hydrolase/transferase [Nocardioides anomalus]QIG41673.1 sulfatase-like hydrolase/transferase [Nocardioides anomalus]
MNRVDVGVAARGALGGLAALALVSASPVPPLASAAPAAAADARPGGHGGGQGRAPRKPNIVFMLADDLGWSDLRTGRVNGGHGSDFNDTPAIDRLAAEGMSFDNAYACLNCAPTRMELLGGSYPTRAENNVFAVDSLDRGGPDTLLVGPPQGREDGADVLAPQTRTVGETLQRAGYRTGYIGKFHVTRSGSDVVAQHGFDENLGGSEWGLARQYFATDGQFDLSVGPELDRFAGDYTQEYVAANIAPYSSGVSPAQLAALVGTRKHVSDAVADATIDFIDRNDRAPFLAWMSPYAVHEPTGVEQARPDLLAKYQARPPGTTASQPSYAALTEGLDQSVARVIDHLESTPDPRNPGHVLADNTLVIFTSDNGGREDTGASNGPLRGQKGELYEGGVRVPWIAWSGSRRLVEDHTRNHAVINATDLYPTLASYAGARVPRRAPLDGTDLREAIETKAKVEGRPRFGHMPGYLVDGGRAQRPESTVRDGRWKLTYSYEDRTLRLNDLGRDLGEAVDRAAAKPGVVARLGLELVDWLHDTTAPLARLRPGLPPLTLTVPHGVTYADGRIRHHRRATTLVIQPGQEVPLVLPLPRQRRHGHQAHHR